jgi:glycosyltransferase involved in cell wall biosynthesis
MPAVGMVGRVQPIKGQDRFLRMAARVAAAMPDARFVIIGAYDPASCYYRRLVRLRRRLGLEGRVHFTGYLEPIGAVMARLQVVVIASRMEQMPLVALEAMAAGRPVVAVDVGGVREMVEDGVTGYVTAPSHEAGLADAVVGLLKEPEKAERLGAAGRARVEQRFTAAGQAARIEAALLQLLDERRAADQRAED